jgi:alpha-L-fucosidase 2
MLLQSQTGVIHLLPALPEAWPGGEVKGLKARGGFEVDLAWADGLLTEVRIKSLKGQPMSVQYGEYKVDAMPTEVGSVYVFDGALESTPGQ